MFRVVATEFDAPKEVLRHRELPLRELKPEQVHLKMLFRPVDPSRLIPVTGAYRDRTHLPAVPWCHGVGVVTQVGPAVDERLHCLRVTPGGAEDNWQNRRTNRCTGVSRARDVCFRLA